MTTVQPSVGTGDLDPAVQRDLDDLRLALAAQVFPGTQDDLIATCLGRHEPVRVVSRLALLARERVYRSADEVVADVADVLRVGVVTVPRP